MSMLFGKGPTYQQPKAVAVADPNDPLIKKAAMDEARSRAASGGRESTDLSGGGVGQAYGGNRLGR